MKWTFANDYDLIFVVRLLSPGGAVKSPYESQAVHQKVLQLLYVDELLETVKSTFCDLVNPSRMTNPKTLDYSKFTGAAFAPAFKKLHDDVEAKHIAKKTEAKTMKVFAETERGKKMAKEGKLKKSAAKKKSRQNASAADEESDEEDEFEPASPVREGTPSPVPTPVAAPAVELEEVFLCRLLHEHVANLWARESCFHRLPRRPHRCLSRARRWRRERSVTRKRKRRSG